MSPLSLLHGPSAIQRVLLGLLIGVVAWLLSRLVMRNEERRFARLGLALLLLYAVTRGISLLLDSEPHAQELLKSVALFFLLASIGRSLFLVVAHALMGRGFGYRMPRIVQDLAQGGIFIGVALLSLQSAGVNPTSLLATSAVLTAVLGLSLQETLGNLFAGLAIQGEQPFEIGDWVQFDADRVGRVVEINWRATKIETADRILITVPNGVLARAPIANFSRPQPFARRAVLVDVAYGTPPNVAELMETAAIEVEGVLSSPPPSAVILELGPYSVRYRLRFFMTDHARSADVSSRILRNVLGAFERNDIAIPFPRQTLDIARARRQNDAEQSAPLVARRRVIDRIQLLSALGDYARNELAALSKVWRYAKGESVVREGETGHELFIVVSGQVKVQIQQRGAAVEIARLGAGEFFGEMSLLTGESRAATVVALEETEVIVVDHGAFQRAIEQDPTVLSQISQELARRQAELSARLASGGSVYPAETAPLLLARIRRFFGVPQ